MASVPLALELQAAVRYLWMLVIKCGTPERAFSVLNLEAISPAPENYIIEIKNLILKFMSEMKNNSHSIHGKEEPCWKRNNIKHDQLAVIITRDTNFYIDKLIRTIEGPYLKGQMIFFKQK